MHTTPERTSVDKHGAAVTIHDSSGRRTEMLGPFNSFGRHPSNTHQVRDRIVSKQHCEIIQRAGDYVVRDLGSLNGTYINGERAEEHVLKDHDEIGLGGARMVFHAQVVGPSTERTLVEVDDSDGFESHRAPTELSYIMALPDDHADSVSIKGEVPRAQSFLPFSELKDPEVQARDYERLRAAFEVSRAVGAELDLERLFEKVLETTMALLPANRAALLLLDRKSGELVVRSSKQTGTLPEDALNVSQTILKRVMQERAGVLSNDTLQDERFASAQSVILQGIRSTMAAPLIHQHELFGAVVLDSIQATNVFGPKDLELLQAMAQQAAAALHARLLQQHLAEQREAREQFERLLSPAVVEQVVRGEVELKKGGELKHVTILFTDIRGFTAMTESYDPQQVVELLNEYFELMVEIVFRHDGAIDKFVGDEIMALFGVPSHRDDDPVRAVRAALEMQSVLRVFNHARRGRNMPQIDIGIGINTGEVVAGYLGSSKSLSYTVVGDPVNTCARLCGVAKAGQILISESTKQLVQSAFELRELSAVTVKGKAQPLAIFEVLRSTDSE